MKKAIAKDIAIRLIAIALMTLGGLAIIAGVKYAADGIKAWDARQQEDANRRLGPIEDMQKKLIEKCLEAGGIPSVIPKYQTSQGWISNKLERCDLPPVINIKK